MAGSDPDDCRNLRAGSRENHGRTDALPGNRTAGITIEILGAGANVRRPEGRPQLPGDLLVQRSGRGASFHDSSLAVRRRQSGGRTTASRYCTLVPCRSAIRAPCWPAGPRKPIVGGDASGSRGGSIGAKAACAAIGSLARTTRDGQWVAPAELARSFMQHADCPNSGRAGGYATVTADLVRRPKKGRLQEPPLTGYTDGF